MQDRVQDARPEVEERPELLHPIGPYESDPAYRTFVSYIDKSREYYAAQGYPHPYRWATHSDAPFALLPKPLANCRVGLVTTALALSREAAGLTADDLPPASVYAAPIEPPPDWLYTDNRSWDKEATHTEDVDSFFPVNRLREAAAEGRVGSLSRRFYGVPTEYSQRRTREVDAPELLRLMREDEVDVAVLVPL